LERSACNAVFEGARILRSSDERRGRVRPRGAVHRCDGGAGGVACRQDRPDRPAAGGADRELQLVFDEAQGTAVVLQYFNHEENLRAGAETFAAMDPSETPGSRVSVDTGELKVEREL
jgi:hypothetical protein